MYVKELPPDFLTNEWTTAATAGRTVAELRHTGKSDSPFSFASSNAFSVLSASDPDADDESCYDNWTSQDYQDLVVSVAESVLPVDDDDFPVDLLQSLDPSVPVFVPSVPISQQPTSVVDATPCSFDVGCADASTPLAMAGGGDPDSPRGDASMHYPPSLPSLTGKDDDSSVSSANTDLSGANEGATVADVVAEVATTNAFAASSDSCSIRKAIRGQLVRLKNLDTAGFNGELGKLIHYRKRKNQWGVFLVLFCFVQRLLSFVSIRP